MKISDIVPKKSGESTSMRRISLSFNKIRFSPSFVVWLVFLFIVLAELWSMYYSLYKNLIFKEDYGTASAQSSSVRINFENYQKVVNHLEQVENYHASSTMILIKTTPQAGRENPFAEP